MDIVTWLIPALYIAGIILLIVLIIAGVKLICILTKVDRIIYDVEGKVHSLDSVFELVNKFSNGMLTFTDGIIYSITNFISKIFNNKNGKEE